MARRRFFGTDGIRGRAGEGLLTPLGLLRVGAALGGYFASHPGPIVIGRDTRVSGSSLEAALASGISSAGKCVVLLGVLPTPAVAQMVLARNACAGIVISASHNPYEDNGIKLFSSDGFKLLDAEEAKIEACIDAEFQNKPKAANFASIQAEDKAEEHYISWLLNQVAVDLSGLKVVLDCANGAASSCTPQAFARAGAQIIAIHNEPDGRNINVQCGALHTQALGQAVLQHEADLGVALDGDADRCIIVNERGEVHSGDHIMGSLAVHYQSLGQLPGNKLVATSMSNLGLEVYLRKKGIQLIRTDVGDRYVVEALRQNSYRLGGEQSGHIIDLNFSTTGDGSLTALRLASIMKQTDMPISQLCGQIPTYPQILHNIKVDSRHPIESMPKLQDAIRLAESELGEQGRVLVRYSGTELLARVMIEGPDQAQITQLAHDIGRHF